MNGNIRDSELGAAWELPGSHRYLDLHQAEEEEQHSAFLIDPDDDDEDLDFEGDPLTMVFQDEEEENKDPVDKKDTRSKKWFYVGGGVMLLVLVILMIPLIVWIVDLKRAEAKFRSEPPLVQSVSVDVRDKVPVVSLEVSLQAAFFPRWSTLDPQRIECELSYPKGTVSADVIEVDSNDDSLRTFSLNATLTAENDKEMDTVIRDYGAFSWQILTQQAIATRSFKCHLHWKTTIGGVIPWHHVEEEWGVLDLARMMGKKAYNDDDYYSNDDDFSPPTAWTPDTMGDDETTSVGDVFTEPSSFTNTSSNQDITVGDNTEATTSPVQQQPTSTEMPIVHLTVPFLDGTEAETQSTSGVSILKVNADQIILGVHLSLPLKVVEAIPKGIEIQLPPVWLSVQTNQHEQAFQVYGEEFHHNFVAHNNTVDWVVKVGCGGTSATEVSCPWYNPVLDMVADTLVSSPDRVSIVSIQVEAGEDSFLEYMVGKQHNVALFRQRQRRRNRRQLMGDSGNAVVASHRGLLGDDNNMMECIRAQDTLFGDIFLLSWCMSLKLSEGVAIEGKLSFYDFSSTAEMEATWEATDDDILRLDTNAYLEFDWDGNTDDAKVDAEGEVELDLYNGTLIARMSNTADWMPFQMLFRASTHHVYDYYTGNDQDQYIIQVDNADFVMDGEWYSNATGTFTIDYIEESASLVITDNRLQAVMNGEWLGDSLEGTWRILFDQEDIVTGESTLTLMDDGFDMEATSKGKLAMDLQAKAVSSGDTVSIDVSKAKFLVEDDLRADATLNFITDDNMSKLTFKEDKRKHEVSSTWKTDEQGSDTAAWSGNSRAVWYDTVAYATDYTAKITEDSFEARINGEYYDRNFFFNVTTDVDSLRFNIKRALLILDDTDVVADLEGALVLEEPGNNYIYSGQLDLNTREGASVNTAQFQMSLSCSWNEMEEIFECKLEPMVLDYLGINYVDATGDMILDLPAANMNMDVQDDYGTDGRGFDIFLSGAVTNETISGNIGNFKFVSSGETTMDATFTVTLDLWDTSVSYKLEDLISETLMGLDYGAIGMSWDYWDYFTGMTIVMDDMTMVMRGDPWMQSDMLVALDYENSTLSVAMENNTTKLPMDFDFTISIDGDDEVSMSLSAVSQSLPETITQELRDMEMTLRGLTEPMSAEAQKAWSKATEQHTLDYFQQTGSDVASVATTVEIVSQEVVQSVEVGKRNLQEGGGGGIMVIYNQNITYQTTDKETNSPQSVVLAPFEEEADVVTYVESLNQANEELKAVSDVDDVEAPPPPPSETGSAIDGTPKDDAATVIPVFTPTDAPSSGARGGLGLGLTVLVMIPASLSCLWDLI